MILKKMTKKDWIVYAVRMLIFVLLWFGLKIYKKNNQNQQKQVSALDLCLGEYQLLTTKQENCGNISIQIDKDSIIISFQGDKIRGENILGKSYVLEPIEYKNLKMTSNTLNSETYYLCEIEDSYILLLKVRNESPFVDIFNLQKYDKLFLLCDLSHKDYNFLLDYPNSIELYKRCYVGVDSNRYTCFFIQ